MYCLPSASAVHQRFAQCILAILLLFLSGSFFSLSVFSVAVEQSAPNDSLQNVWVQAMSLMSLVAIPFMIWAGVVLNNGKECEPLQHIPLSETKTGRLRIVTIISAASVCFMFLTGPAIKIGCSWLVITIVAMQGIPFNLTFLLALEMLAAWLPKRPGLAIGVGEMVFWLGTVFFAQVFAFFLDKFGCISAINLSSALIASFMFIAGTMLTWPLRTSVDDEDAGNQTSSSAASRKMSLGELLNTPTFWLYVFCILTAQFGFAFITYFFKISVSFNQPMHKVVQAYDVMYFSGIIVLPVLGLLSDASEQLTTLLACDSKNLTALILWIQAVGFLFLIPLSNAGIYVGFVVASSIIVMAFAAGIYLAPILARDMFSSTNSFLAFGVGGSLAFGVGEYLVAQIMASMASEVEGPMNPSSYNPFYFVAFAWSLLGVTAAQLIIRYDEPCTESPLGQSRGVWATSETMVVRIDSAVPISQEAPEVMRYGTVIPCEL